VLKDSTLRTFWYHTKGQSL